MSWIRLQDGSVRAVKIEMSEFNGTYIGAIEVNNTLDELKKVLLEHFVLFTYYEDMLIAIGTYLTEDRFFKEKIIIEAWEWEWNGKSGMVVRMYSRNREFLTHFLEYIAKRLEREGGE